MSKQYLFRGITWLVLVIVAAGLVACQTPTVVAPTPLPGPVAVITRPAPAIPLTPAPSQQTRETPSATRTPVSNLQSPVPGPQSPVPSPQSPITNPPSPTPRPTPTPTLPFGLEQSHVLASVVGGANVFGRTRIPADPSAFAPDHTVRRDPDAFRGSRELVTQALEQGQVAFVLEMDVDDPPQVIAQKARSLAVMHPTARPWLIIIGNELNLRRMVDYPVETYYAQLRAAYDAVKAVAPTVNISTDGQNYWEGAPFEHPMADPNASNRIRALLKLFERDQWVPDFITIHIFDSVWAPGDAREVYSLVGRMRFYDEILAGYRLPRRPGIYVGEYGLPVVQVIPNAQAGKYWRFFITEREQADIAVMAAVWSAATGVPLNYFGGLDTPTEGLRRNERGEIVEGVYGLVSRDDDRPRPAFIAYQRMQTLARDATGQIIGDGRNGVGGVCFTLSPTVDVGRLGDLGGLKRPGQACVVQATTGRNARFTSNPLPTGVRFHVEDVLGQPIANAARLERDGRVTVDLPGAPAQKTGGAVRVLYIEAP